MSPTGNPNLELKANTLLFLVGGVSKPILFLPMKGKPNNDTFKQ